VKCMNPKVETVSKKVNRVSNYLSRLFETILTCHFFQKKMFYRAFHGFGQAKFSYNGSILGSSQFASLPQLPLKLMLHLKVVKINSKIIISLHKSKSVTHSVPYIHDVP